MRPVSITLLLVDPVAQAATRSADAGTVALRMDGTVDAAGQRVPLKGAGAFDLKTRRGRFTLTTAIPGRDTMRIDEVLDDETIYMHSPAFARTLPDGKRWLKIDLRAVARRQGLDVDSLQSLGAGNNPTQFLQFLEKSGSRPQKVGEEQIDGTPTTRYRATIDFGRLARSSDDPGVDARSSSCGR